MMSKKDLSITTTTNVALGEIFECNICFHEASEAVVTCCGHLFCWPCLYMWLYVHSSQRSCPVCKGKIEEGNITPIYGPTNSMSRKALWIDGVFGDKGERMIPPRPQAQRIQCRGHLVCAHNEREDGNIEVRQFIEGQAQQPNEFEQSALELASSIPLPDQSNLEEIVSMGPNEQTLEVPNVEVLLESVDSGNENLEGNILAHLDQRQLNGVHSLQHFHEDDETTSKNIEDIFDIQHSTT